MVAAPGLGPPWPVDELQSNKVKTVTRARENSFRRGPSCFHLPWTESVATVARDKSCRHRPRPNRPPVRRDRTDPCVLRGRTDAQPIWQPCAQKCRKLQGFAVAENRNPVVNFAYASLYFTRRSTVIKQTNAGARLISFPSPHDLHLAPHSSRTCSGGEGLGVRGLIRPRARRSLLRSDPS